MTATVFANDMVAHVWAQARQDSGRSHNGNFYFEGRTLYSYGRHYVAGYIAADGSAFLNSTRHSISTSKHQAFARRAVSHRTYHYLPNLEDIVSAISSPGAWNRAHVERYLAQNWDVIAPESTGAAWLLKSAGSRATWAAMRTRHEAAHKREMERRASNRLLVEQAAAKGFAVVPMATVIGEGWLAADSYRQCDLDHMIGRYAKAHKAVPARHKVIRAAVWARLKALRAILATARDLSDSYGNPLPRLKARAALYRLRVTKDSGKSPANWTDWTLFATSIDVVLAGAHMPPELRRAASALAEKARAESDTARDESTRLQRLSSARRAALGAFRNFNELRRQRAAFAARVATDDPLAPTPENRLYWLREMIASAGVINRWAEDSPYNAQHAPSVVARCKSVAVPLLRETLAINAELQPLEAAIAAQRKAEREARKAEDDRVAALSPEALAAEWIAGTVSDSVARNLPYPLLRARDAVVDGCTVSGGTLETGHGATVPLRHAFKVFQFVAACRAGGRRWFAHTSNAADNWGPRHIRAGHFELSAIYADGSFVAGCHSIRWQEIEALAKALGVAECLMPLPDASAAVAGND